MTAETVGTMMIRTRAKKDEAVNRMQKKRRVSGFTMAELLIVVAIITVLSGVGFIAVQNHQRSMALLERNTVAKEIFIAAQNHLVMAESQGYPGVTSFGTPDVENTKGPYSVASYSGSGFGSGSILDVMLPFASIDETVRKSGYYVIHYQDSPARVLDVYYWEKGKNDTPTYAYSALSAMTEANRKDNLVGYYGGEEALAAGNFTILPPEITVINGERLIVKITDTNAATAALKLIITSYDADGKVKAQAAIEPKEFDQTKDSSGRGRVTGGSGGTPYTVVLDDITESDMRFAELNTTSADWFSLSEAGVFTPGEDITVQAVAYSNATLSNIAYSNAETTNSLFAYVEKEQTGLEDEDDGNTALIANFRHLENMDKRVSVLSDDAGITAARQTADLVWPSTAENAVFTASATVYYDADATTYTSTASGCYLPVNLDYPLVYDGGIEAGKAPTTQGGTDGTNARYHKITGVKVAGNDAAFSGQGGLFGDITETTTIQNLELIDFSINSTGSAGALAGTVTGTASAKAKIENVLAHNSTADATATITSTAGSAGGLIGEMTYCDVNKCAAALVVSGSTNAGGLIGKSSGGSVSGSYSGGHTDAVTGTKYDGDHINVTATSGSAGGLIGDAKGSDSVSTKTTIDCCYSTCSASGTTVGGLVGKVGGSIENSYATGLVKGASATSSVGAFAGEHSSSSFDGCQYFEIINELTDGTTGLIDYMKPVPGKLAEDEATATADKISGITRIDATADIYDAFVGVPSTTTGAVNAVKKWTSVMVKDAAGTDTLTCYNTSLATLYQNEFSLKTVAQLGADDITETATAETPADFVATHYGDWPAPETLVTNN